MEDKKFSYYTVIQGTFSVDTEIENLNAEFIKALAPDKEIVAPVPWDGAWEMQRLVTGGCLMGHKLFNVPGIIRKAKWVTATDDPYSSRTFFYVEGCAIFHDLISMNEASVCDDRAVEAVRKWMTAVGYSLHRVDGVIFVGDRSLSFPRSFPRAEPSEYESVARWLHDSLSAPHYRFYPEGDTQETIYAGETFCSLQLLKEQVEKYYKGVPVRYEVTDDGGMTWDPYTPDADEQE